MYDLTFGKNIIYTSIFHQIEQRFEKSERKLSKHNNIFNDESAIVYLIEKNKKTKNKQISI